MGMDVGKESGGLNSQINVTPLADVMLVLLIIVMLIAPLLQAGVLVTLPEAANTAEKADNDSQTVLHVDSAGRFFVDVMAVLDRLQRSGIEDIALITERKLRGAAGG